MQKEPCVTLYGVIGHPINHSKSPLIHNAGFEHHGINASYCAWDIVPDTLATFITYIRYARSFSSFQGIKHIAGLSVTIPHKQTCMPLLDYCTPRATLAGAVNTLYWEEATLCGDNTDIDGFLAPLQVFTKQNPIADFLVLGAGGATKAVIVALSTLSPKSISIHGRNAEKIQAFIADLHPSLQKICPIRYVDSAELATTPIDCIINTTPLGMTGANIQQTPLSKTLFANIAMQAKKAQKQCLAYDLIYTPQETLFLHHAKEFGWSIQNGLAMFMEQGNSQFLRWTGKQLPLEYIKQLLLDS